MSRLEARSLMVVAACAAMVCAVLWDVCQAADGVIEGQYCAVRYTGVDQSWAQALATVYDTAWQGYREAFGMKPPNDAIIQVTTGAEATRLWNDGDKYIFLDLRDIGDLRPSSGYLHVYGVCHEAGHLVMYSKLSSLAGLPAGVGEGWAHYAGSLVLDYVWAELGTAAWPEPHDYSAQGSGRLREQCSRTDKDADLLAACTFLAIGEQYGHRKVGWAMRGALTPEPRGDGLMGRFAEILDAQAGAGASELIPDSVRKSVIVPTREPIILDAPATVRTRASWSDEEGWLGYDDDHEDGMRSIAGSGHAVKFSCAGGGELAKVMLKGARYGYPQSDSSFRLSILDDTWREITFFEYPYMEFSQRGEPLYWVEFDGLGVAVPEEFYVAFDFSPSATDGVYVGYDAHSSGHSVTGLPGGGFSPFREGDWMMRVQLAGVTPAAPAPAAAAAEPPSGADGWLSYDDDGEDGMRSIAGSGHAIRFYSAAAGELTKVRLKGARYGYPESDSRFWLTILDGGREVIRFFEFPYMKFPQRGEPLYWVDFDLSGVEVAGEFYVLLNFDPSATDGVYVGFDEDAGGHSFSGLPNTPLRPFNDGDWMIRALVE